MSKATLRGIAEVFSKAGKGFVKNKVPKLSAALAYYTIFSIGPMLLVIIHLANIFFGKKAIEGTIVGQLENFIGTVAASQIQEILRNASVDSSSTFAAIVGLVTLVIGATTVFSEIQDSLNTIWHLKIKDDSPWWKLLITRLLSFSIVVALSFLLLVSLVINGLLEGLMGRLQQMFPDIGFAMIYIINLVITLLVTAVLFGIIFKVLPDAHIRWQDVSIGAIFTAILFNVAKFGITIYIGRSDIGSAYGAAGSLIVLLLWIYFSSMILYFGAEFTKAYAMKFGVEIRPNDYTVAVQTMVVESEHKSLQQNEEEEEEMERRMQQQKEHAGHTDQ